MVNTELASLDADFSNMEKFQYGEVSNLGKSYFHLNIVQKFHIGPISNWDIGQRLKCPTVNYEAIVVSFLNLN